MKSPSPLSVRKKWLSLAGLMTAGALVGALVGACGPGRTAAATQPSPAAFDPAASDPKAIEAVDTMIEALGGAAAWEGVKQIRWTQKYNNADELKAWFRHSWDRWNGRHRFETAEMDSYRAALAEGDPGDTKFSTAMYDLFDHEGKGYAMFDGREVLKSDRDRIVKVGYDRWKIDSYQLTMIHKLRDPGVVLSVFGEVKDVDGVCSPACIAIKVSFADGVGTDSYVVDINKSSNLPEIVEKQVSGGRIGYRLSEWVTVGGLKFAGKQQNIGLKSEVFLFEDIRIGSPDDELYVPRVR